MASDRRKSTLEFARLEERRQAIATCDCSIESEPIGGGWMSFAGEGSWANQACCVGLDGPVPGAEIDRLVEFYVSRNVEPRIEVCSLADESLVRGLADRGFQLREFENVHLRRIMEDEKFDFATSSSDFKVVKVDPENAAQVEEHVRVGMSGFFEGEPSEGMLESGHKAATHPRTRAFNVECDNRVVGAGSCEIYEKASAFFGVSVLPDYRRRGIQLALLAKRLETARKEGCLFSAIHTKPGSPSERNAYRVGFRLEYVKVIMTLPGEGLSSSP